jgi:predicted Fe-S protein YdhL (DUF1289 family)
MEVKSPCIGACVFDDKTKLCVGCFRTPDEIRRWEKMTDLRRQKITDNRARRQAKLRGE